MAEVTVNTPDFDDGAARYARAMDKTLRTWAFEVERRAKQKSPVDTGFNANTIYTVAPDGQMYSNQQRVAQRPGLPVGPSRKNPRRKAKEPQFAQQAPIGSGGLQDVLATMGGNTVGVTARMSGGQERQGPQPAPDMLAAEVRVGAEYAIYLEMGTIHMRARPFLGPAAAEVTPMLDSMLRKNLKAEGLL